MQNSVVWTKMCVWSVCTHPSYNDKKSTQWFFKIPILKSPFSNQAVLRFLSEWRSSAQTAPTIVNWQVCLTLDPPWVICHPSIIVSTPVQGKTRCLRLSDWGVLLLDVIMNIAVVINSRHLSSWKRRGLMLLSFWREWADPDLHKCIYVHVNHSWSSFMYRRSEYKGFLWIFANRLS